MAVEKALDELWVGAKDLSNSVIAGSPRNSFRASLHAMSIGGRALIGLGSLPGYRSQSNSECQSNYMWSQTVGDKLHSRKGNSPARQLRPQKSVKCLRM